jgi:hypothetical protein
LDRLPATELIRIRAGHPIKAQAPRISPIKKLAGERVGIGQIWQAKYQGKRMNEESFFESVFSFPEK